MIILKWQVEVGMSNLVIEEPFKVLSYDVRGLVQSSGQPIAGMQISEIYLRL